MSRSMIYFQTAVFLSDSLIAAASVIWYPQNKKAEVCFYRQMSQTKEKAKIIKYQT